jgi:hypothetical protein
MLRRLAESLRRSQYSIGMWVVPRAIDYHTRNGFTLVQADAKDTLLRTH